ncbi:MAG: hypothetical protein ACK47F_03705 [Flavobacteriales bacterium]
MRLFFLLFISFNVFGQIGTGQWRLHVPSRRAIDVLEGNGTIYTAFESGLMEYDLDSKEITVMNDVNGLSDISLTCLAYDNSRDELYIGYDNGNLDKVENNSVINIPAIKLAEIPGSKRINKIVPFEGYVYLATGFSIVKIDPVKNEVKDTWYPTNGNDPILDVAFRNDSIYALSSSTLYRGSLDNFALADPAQWSVDTRLPVLTVDSYREIESFDGALYYIYSMEAYGQDSVFRIDNNGNFLVTDLPFTLEIKGLKGQADKLHVILADGVFTYGPDLTLIETLNTYSFASDVRANAVHTYNNALWIADEEFGLVQYSDPTNSVKISFEGPPNKQVYSMDWLNGKLAVASGGLSGISATFNIGGVYLFEDEKWVLHDKSNMTMWNGQNIWDFLSVSINPTNDDQIAVGNYSEIPLSILTARAQVTDTFTALNSPLSNALGGSWSLVSSVKYDEMGNLWLLNGYADQPLIVYTKDHSWYTFDCGTSAKNRFSKKMVIDYNNNKWFSLDGVGLFGYNDNGTIDNPADDQYVNLNTGSTTGALPSTTVNAVAVDFDNEIWIGTDNGFAVLYNSESAFGAAAGDYNAQRIKVDFEGNVEYVLGNTNITDIEVDGGNRKWFGTANSGIILLSADGQEVIEQYSTDNSPLISNTIIDLKLDQSTGELFIVTDKGLVSYRTDATYEDPDYTAVNVFPNPARPEFEGPITIQGVRYNSDVKITDVAGNLVYKTASNGGTATWNGKNINGEKVSTGVYLIWTAANEGKGRYVGKVLVVH